MFDASQQLLIAHMREEELRAAWRAANGPRRAPRRRDVGAARLRSAVGATFIRIGQAVTDFGRAVGRTAAE